MSESTEYVGDGSWGHVSLCVCDFLLLYYECPLSINLSMKFFEVYIEGKYFQRGSVFAFAMRWEALPKWDSFNEKSVLGLSVHLHNVKWGCKLE